MGIVIAIFYIFVDFIRVRIKNRLLRVNEQYITKHKHEYYRIEANSIFLRSGTSNFLNRQWILEDDTLVMKPDEKRDKDQTTIATLLSDIVKIDIEPTKDIWQGKHYFLLVWHKNSVHNTVPLEHRIATYNLPFLPIGLEGAEEIVRRVTENSPHL